MLVYCVEAAVAHEVMNKKPKRKVGRPSGYKPEYAELARKVCEVFGSIDSELAAFFRVSTRTFNSWKIQHPEFLHSLKTGKEHPDERVVNSLYNRAIGYSYDAVKIFMHEGKPVKVPYREHVPPDVTACIFWLKNRRPDLWRDRHDLAATVKTLKIPAPLSSNGTILSAAWFWRARLRWCLMT
jgi:hypothetical protein